jgi:hypothetical protein
MSTGRVGDTTASNMGIIEASALDDVCYPSAAVCPSRIRADLLSSREWKGALETLWKASDASPPIVGLTAFHSSQSAAVKAMMSTISELASKRLAQWLLVALDEMGLKACRCGGNKDPSTQLGCGKRCFPSEGIL